MKNIADNYPEVRPSKKETRLQSLCSIIERVFVTSWFVIFCYKRKELHDLIGNHPRTSAFNIHENPFCFSLGKKHVVAFSKELVAPYGPYTPKIHYPRKGN